MLLGSTSAKAVRRTLMKLTLGLNFINVKRANFTYESLFYGYVLALNEVLYKKHACKTLMKLTLGGKRERGKSGLAYG